MAEDVAEATDSLPKETGLVGLDRPLDQLDLTKMLADTAGGRCQASEPIRQAAEDACIVDQGIRHEAEPELGGTVDGPATGLDATPGPLVNRIDRLRLLGNGVVNQTAAKAFAMLSARLDRHLKAE